MMMMMLVKMGIMMVIMTIVLDILMMVMTMVMMFEKRKTLIGRKKAGKGPMLGNINRH